MGISINKSYQWGCDVWGKISDSDSRFRLFQNFRLRLLNTKGMKFGCQVNGNRGAQQESSVSNKGFKRNCSISTGIPNLRMWCKNDPIGHPESDKTIQLPVLLGIQLRLHPKTSDSLRLRFRRRLRDPGCQPYLFLCWWKKWHFLLLSSCLNFNSKIVMASQRQWWRFSFVIQMQTSSLWSLCLKLQIHTRK